MRRLRGEVGRGRCSPSSSPTCPLPTDPSLLVGLAPFDDAAIYRIDDDTALVSTTDFFPPLVDDPADYGAIAAANACSDVFAMGGRVVLAINVAAFPEQFPRFAMAAIFDAAADGRRRGRRHRRRRAHDPQPRAGVRARGAGARPPRPGVPQGRGPAGDVVVLSKPLGTGLTLAGGSDDETRRRPPSACGRSTGPPRRRCSRSGRRSTPSPT